MTPQPGDPTSARVPVLASGSWAALAVLLLGAFLPVLDFTAVNLALPAIRADLHASPAELQLVMNGYSSAYGVLQITGGRLGDRFGRRRMFMTGLACFTLTSALCGAAPSASVLILARILQAVSATLMAPQVIASIRTIFPEERLGHALAFYGATFGLAYVTGQIAGGLLVSARVFGLSWQPIFLINVPLGLMALAGARLVLPDSRAPDPPKLDVGGVALCSATLFCLVFPLTTGREQGWPAWSLALIASAPPLAIAFLRWEARVLRRGGDPLVRPDLFRRPSMALGIPVAMAFYATSAFFLVIAVFLQDGTGLTPAQAGTTLLPLSAAYLLVALDSPRLAVRFGSGTLAAGLGTKALGLATIAAATLAASGGDSVIGLVLVGCGFGIVMPSIVGVVVSGVEARHAGLAAGVVTSALQVGGALGVALIGGLFFHRLGPSPAPADYPVAFASACILNAAAEAVAMALAIAMARRMEGGPR